MTRETSKNKSSLPAQAELQSLIERAYAGDQSAVPGIRGILDSMPQAVRLFGGDLAHEAEQALVRAIAGKNLAQREALTRKMEQLRAELGGPNPGPLERLLVERVALCWLNSSFADLQFALAKNTTLQFGIYLQRQQSRAHQRLLSAIKSLATVRRLVLPIQLDVTVAGVMECPPRPTSRTTPASRREGTLSLSQRAICQSPEHGDRRARRR